MKKRRFALLGAVLLLAASLCLMIACKEGETKDLQHVEAVAATCTEPGMKEYWKDTETGTLYLDAEGSQAVSEADLAVPALGHDVCAVAATEATCTAPGMQAHYGCSRCDALFSDAEGQTIVTEAELLVPARGHTIEHKAMVFPTTETEGTVEHWSCSVCGGKFLDELASVSVSDDSELIIAKVKENLDGIATGTYYSEDKAYSAGAADFAEGGKGFVVNANRDEDGVYLHISLNFDTPVAEQTAEHGKVGVIIDVRNMKV